MGKIRPKFVTASEEFLFVIDDKGRVWRQSVERIEWQHRGELPDEPDEKGAAPVQIAQDAPAKDETSSGGAAPV